MRLLAPAKINLHLRVGPRDDASGFHPLASWFCTVGLFDTLTIRQDPADLTGRIAVHCDHPGVPRGETNLVVRAAEALRSGFATAASPDLRGATRINLDKRIPVGGGLGGGSSDAARTLLGLNRLWKLNLPSVALHDIAARLGSDVPFFLHAEPSSLCTGRGEVVRRIPPPKPRWALLTFPPFALATSEVFVRFDEMRLGEPRFDAPWPWQEWADLSAGPLLARLRNDIEPAAFSLRPELGRLRAALEQSLGRVIRMTGSGSTLFTLFDERAGADAAAAAVRARYSLDAMAVELSPSVIDDDLSATA